MLTKVWTRNAGVGTDKGVSPPEEETVHLPSRDDEEDEVANESSTKLLILLIRGKIMLCFSATYVVVVVSN